MRFILLSILLCLSLESFGSSGRKYEVTSFSRIFYDDNVFMRAAGTTNQVDTLYFSQSIGLNAKFFSDFLTLRATPEIRRREVDNLTQFFGQAQVKTKLPIGPKLVIESGNSFSHSEREPSDIDDDVDVTYFMNKANLKVSWQPTYLNKIRFNYDNNIKRWSENLPVGSGTELTNGDYTKEAYTIILERIAGKRFILEAIGTRSFLEFNGNRGGLDHNVYYGQISYVPNAFMILKANYGRINAWSQNQSGSLEEYSTPTYGANLTFFTPRGTVIGFNSVYEVMDSSVAYWNMKENLKTSMIIKYMLTPKLEISGMAAHLLTEYKDIGNRYAGLNLEREEEVFVSSVTLSWKYNQFHYAEVGYQGLHLFNKDADVFKNKYFVGYRWKF